MPSRKSQGGSPAKPNGPKPIVRTIKCYSSSTAHITRDDKVRLNRDARLLDDRKYYVPKNHRFVYAYPTGYFVECETNVEGDAGKTALRRRFAAGGYSAAFLGLLTLAAGEGCALLWLDSETEPEPGRLTFNW